MCSPSSAFFLLYLVVFSTYYHVFMCCCAFPFLSFYPHASLFLLKFYEWFCCSGHGETMIAPYTSYTRDPGLSTGVHHSMGHARVVGHKHLNTTRSADGHTGRHQVVLLDYLGEHKFSVQILPALSTVYLIEARIF